MIPRFGMYYFPPQHPDKRRSTHPQQRAKTAESYRAAANSPDIMIFRRFWIIVAAVMLAAALVTWGLN